MFAKVTRVFCGLVAAMPLFLTGCSSNSSTTPPPTAQNGTPYTSISDASSEDWAIIGVKVLSISLTPQGGGAPVNVLQ